MSLSETSTKSLRSSIYSEEMKILAVEASNNVDEMCGGINLRNESGIVTKSNSMTSGLYFTITKILMVMKVSMFS